MDLVFVQQKMYWLQLIIMVKKKRLGFLNQMVFYIWARSMFDVIKLDESVQEKILIQPSESELNGILIRLKEYKK